MLLSDSTTTTATNDHNINNTTTTPTTPTPEVVMVTFYPKEADRCVFHALSVLGLAALASLATGTHKSTGLAGVDPSPGPGADWAREAYPTLLSMPER